MITYKSSGVDIEAGDELVRRLKEKSPHIGGFGGCFPLSAGRWKNPVLVASTDGVGTKLLVAEAVKKHSTIGIDLVAMVVNDISVCGAKPLFFLDYYATGKLMVSHAEEVIGGIQEGCRQAGCLLLGGETAELPGLYAKGVYDLAGFGVGIAEKRDIVDGRTIRAGDVFIGVASSGLHSNGYSLARKVLLEKSNLPLGKIHEDLGEKLGEALLRPTLIYTPLINDLMKKLKIKGMAHITGGGIPGNLCRILPPGIDAVICPDSWDAPLIFDLIQRLGPVPEEEMFRTFNMGLGLILTVAHKDAQTVHRICRRHELPSYEIGAALEGGGAVRFV
ncbi:MAG: Phosphoribosylformylglycinamidine cyclo-ligase [candidate division BRC1 bacterium ADurb.Bin183]|nr:MAG: Phosphoribosylformylglycinamidine cyclo-ligase [candidate division BRC1 bacterium ADurb.Bin183]